MERPSLRGKPCLSLLRILMRSIILLISLTRACSEFGSDVIMLESTIVIPQIMHKSSILTGKPATFCDLQIHSEQNHPRK